MIKIIFFCAGFFLLIIKLIFDYLEIKLKRIKLAWNFEIRVTCMTMAKSEEYY